MIVGGQTRACFNYHRLSSTIIYYHAPFDRGFTCHLSGQEWLGILQLLPNLFMHLKCNRHYCSLKKLFLCFAGLFPADQLCSLMQQHPKKIQTNIYILFHACIFSLLKVDYNDISYHRICCMSDGCVHVTVLNVLLVVEEILLLGFL